MIQVGTSLHAIAGFGPPGKGFRQSVAEIAECGYSHILLLASESGPVVDETGTASGALVDIRRSDLQAVLRTVSSHGLRVSCVYPGMSLDFSQEGLDPTIAGLKVYRDIAWKLGCHVMVHSAGRSETPRMPLDRKKEQIAQVAEAMNALASDTHGEIFKMAVDIHYGGIIETVADCEHLLTHTPNKNVGLCLNTGHMATLGEDGWTLLEHFPERIHVIAWKDHLVGDQLPKPVVSCQLGKGQTPFRKYVAAYRRVSRGALHLITFEDVPFDEKEEALRRSLEYFRSLFQG